MSLWQKSSDDGMSMIEMMASLVVIAIVATASIGFFLNNIRGVNNQRQHQVAVYLANQQLEHIESIPIVNLVHGRAKADVLNAYASAAGTAMNINTQDDTTNSANWDSAAATSCSATVPITLSAAVSLACGKPALNAVTVNNVPYSFTQFIDICWYDTTTGICGPTSSSTTNPEYRVSVYETWQSPGACSTNCNYSTTTLIDPTSDPVFNTNISSPSGTITNPANSTIYNDNGYTDTCTTGAGSSVGTEVIITGATALTSSIRVKMSTGGGTITNVNEVGATEIDMCVIAGDTPGTYTISVVNTDGGHFQLSLYEIASLSQASGWSPTNPTLTLFGGGIEPGATLTSSSGSSASWSGYTVYNCSTTFTAPCGSSGGLDQVVINNFSGPVNGAAPVLSVTNPDGSTPIPTYTISAPKLGTLSKTAVAVNTTQNINVSGGSGFETTPNTLGVAITAGTGTAIVNYGSASTATLTVAPTAVGTFSGYLYNDDGGKTSPFTITVNPQPTVSTATPNVVVASKTTTVVVNGTGFQTAGFTATGTRGNPTVASVSATSVTLSVTASGTAAGTDVITFLNADGGSVSFSLTVNAAPVVTSASPNPITVGIANTVTVSGSGFVASGFTAAASNGSVSVSSVASGTVTLVATPSATGTDTFTLTNADGGTTTFSLNVVSNPQVTGASPNPVVAGKTTSVTVTGSGFVPSGFTASTTNGTVSVTSVTSTTVVLSVTASSAGSDNITLKNADGGSYTGALTVDAPPNVTTGTPNPIVASQVNTVTLSGTGFVSGLTVAASNGTVSVNSTSATSIVVTVTPSGAGTETLTVTNPDGGQDTQSFTVDAKPVITAISPTTGVKKSTVTTWTLTGTGFSTSLTTSGLNFTEGGVGLTETLVSATSTKVVFTAKTGTNTGTVATSMIVTNPDGGVSNTFNQNISAS